MNTKNMPPGLARYWKKHKRGQGYRYQGPGHSTLPESERAAAAKRVIQKRMKRLAAKKRMRNPIGVFKLAIQKGSRRASRLYLAKSEDKFSSSAPARTFSSIAAVKAAGYAQRRRYGSRLAAYTFLIVPAR